MFWLEAGRLRADIFVSGEEQRAAQGKQLLEPSRTGECWAFGNSRQILTQASVSALSEALAVGECTEEGPDAVRGRELAVRLGVGGAYMGEPLDEETQLRVAQLRGVLLALEGDLEGVVGD